MHKFRLGAADMLSYHLSPRIPSAQRLSFHLTGNFPSTENWTCTDAPKATLVRKGYYPYSTDISGKTFFYLSDEANCDVAGCRLFVIPLRSSYKLNVNYRDHFTAGLGYYIVIDLVFQSHPMTRDRCIAKPLRGGLYPRDAGYQTDNLELYRR